MGKCPFCQAAIPETTLMYGGSCPKCFSEIPGEEAATDPGEEVKASQARSDSRRTLLRTLIPVVLAVPAVGLMLVVAVGFIIWNRNPTVEVMDFGDDDIFNYDIVEAPDPEPDPDPDAVKPGPKPGPKNPNPSQTKAPAPDPEPKQVNGIGEPDAVKVQPKAGDPFGGIVVGPTRGDGEVISDPAAIFKMIGNEMKKKQRTLNECYTKELKTKPGLQGRWRAKFVVNPKGYPENVSFTGVQTQDADFEKCLAKTVSKWKFRKIARPQPVEKSWRFRPSN